MLELFVKEKKNGNIYISNARNFYTELVEENDSLNIRNARNVYTD